MNTPIGVCVTANSCLLAQANEMCAKKESNQITRENVDNWIDQDKQISSLVTTSLNKLNQLITAFKTLPVHEISETEETNLSKLVHDLINSKKDHLEQHDVILNLSCDDLVISTNKKLIQKLFDKLIENSLDHAFEDSQDKIIDISLKKIGKEVSIIYQDNGVGLEFDSLNKLFEPFYTTKRIDKHLGFSATIIYMTVIWGLEGSIQVKSDLGLKYDIRIPAS